MSIVLVTFPGAPKPSAEAIAKEAELEATLERLIKSKYFSLYLLQFSLYQDRYFAYT